jgi:hypothetical protein
MSKQFSAAFETARDFAAHGLAVFPTHSIGREGRCTCGKDCGRDAGKHPLTPHGSKDASCDERQLLHWNDRWPGANWAVACDHVAVVDIDSKSGGDPREVLPKFELEDRPIVWTGATPERCEKYPDSLPGVRGAHVYCAGGTRGGGTCVRGVEVRGRGSYAMLPGSIHVSGIVYEWANRARPWTCALEPLPPGLTPQSAGTRDREPPRAGERVPHGGRHEYLRDRAVRLVRSGVTDERELRALLWTEFREFCVQEPAPKIWSIEALAQWAARSGIADRERQRSYSRADRTPASLLIDMELALADADEDLEFPIEPLAVRGFLTIIAGQHSSRKTWLMLLGGHAVHEGSSSIAGLNCTPTTVLYVDAENGPKLMGRRFRDAGIPAEGLLVADGTKLRLPRDIGLLRELIKETAAGLVVLDSLRRLTPGKRENDSDDMAPVVAEIADLARELNVAIVLIHHRSVKDGAANPRGTSAIEDQADIVFRLDRKGRSVGVLKVIKYRVAEEPKPIWLKIGSSPIDYGRVVMEAAQPQEDEDDAPVAPSMGDFLAGRIRLLADLVRKDSGWAPLKLATAVGRSQDDRSFKQALKTLIDSGEWVAEGSTRARRSRPANSGHSGSSLKAWPEGPNQSEPLEDDG